MANQLIPVFNGTISNEPSLLCNARDLHAFLDVGKRFASWITERITEYEFVENHDYVIISQNREKTGRGRPITDYHLTLDTAKELAMVERNEKGRQVRRYFIECEKQLRQSFIPSTQPAEETYNLTLTRSELCSLCWMWFAAECMREKIEIIHPALHALNSEYAVNFHTMAFEYQQVLEDSRKILARETSLIETHPFSIEDTSWRSVLPKIRQKNNGETLSNSLF